MMKLFRHGYESATPSSREADLSAILTLAITTVLVIKRVFRLTLRAAQGFIDSIFSDERSATLPGLQLCQQAGKVS